MPYMAEEVENLTLRLLQEIRQEVRELREEGRQTRDDFQALRKDLTQRVNGVAVLLTGIAGISHDHEERITSLESR